MRKFSFLATVVLTAICMYANAVHATTYYLEYSNTLGKVAKGDWYARLDITKGNDGLYFTLTANTSIFQPLTKDSGASLLAWDHFYFNMAEGVSLSANDITFTNNNGKWSSTIGANNSVSIFGNFDVGIAGTGNVNGTDPLTFYIANTNLSVEDFTVSNGKDYMFAAHLKNFEAVKDSFGNIISSESSTWLGHDPPPASSVPEPATMILLGTGLAGLGGLLSRRKT